ncbi:radical SAM protein [Geoalkalibacter sp.]|uniref:radical SAM protein n=1 Tax=Geoalkalibacter sp. TaxID=3041440 RepID=UPI00272E6FA1|nr:radical SAM protein [Geoalkalibacter sp.]
MKNGKTFLAVVADEKGEVFEHPFLRMAGMNGMTPCLPRVDELIPLPEGSRLFTLPGLPPVGYDPRQNAFAPATRLPRNWGGGTIQAVCAFMAPAYTRTLLPAADYGGKQMTLPLWAYTAVGWCVEEERFYVAAARVDRNTQWQPRHFDDRKLDPLVRRRLAEQPGNRLLEQLARCAIDYHCFAAKNLFFGRWEAPLPTSPVCNSSCLGCLSLQPEASECCPSSQERIAFVPTVEEIRGVAVPHLEQAQHAIVSFGQGCEGDPILQAERIGEAVRHMRRETARGTIHLNTNGSLPDAVAALADAGLDSIRISLNSVRPALYEAYHRPRGYGFADVIESLRRAKAGGLFTMINYLVFPGVSDQPEEIEALVRLVDKLDVDLVQLRNLSIDPQLYWQAMGEPGPGLGMKAMMDQVKQRVPRLQYGYFNRTRETFYPPGFEQDWPLGA